MKMIGKRINGRYQILENIGGGGMANVYKAQDMILDRIVAVKVLQPQYSNDEQFIKRFRREAQAATSLAHPNVVNIYDVGEEEDTYYIVMEYVEGSTLKEYIQNEGRLSIEEAVHIMQQIMSAISHAHVNHIIHRDIKPHNILISKLGEAKVTDFGIARAMSSATITHTNSVMGSVHYLSPEQARGGVINYKSDIYSLGIVLYEMITGKVPFSGDTAVSIALKHLQSDLPSPKIAVPTLPQSIENIITRATAKDPLHRYQSVREMEEDLETALEPARYNEEKYVLPNQEGEETKAIPMVHSGWESVQEDDATIEVKPNQRDYSEPSSPNKKEGKKKRWLVIGMVSIAVLFTAVIVAFAVLPAIFKVDEVEVPNVVEMEYDEAFELLTELGLSVEREDIPHDEIEEGFIVRQDPLGESVVKVNTVVTLSVSEGKEKVEVPDVLEESREQAERILRNAGFEVNTIEQESDKPAGTILDQDPSPNSLVIQEETTVVLTYSVEPPVRLVNLRGLTSDEAKNYLLDEGLVPNFKTEYSETVEKGYVISQQPAALSQVKKGSEVTLTISEGPEPKKEPETRNIDVKIPVEVSPEHKAQGVIIRIVYDDVTTNGEELFIEEPITDTKTYILPLKVSPEKEGVYKLYINDKEARTNRYPF